MKETQTPNQTTNFQSSSLDNSLGLDLFMGSDGYHYALLKEASNSIAFKVISPRFRLYITARLSSQGKSTKSRELDELVDRAKALAETSGRQFNVYTRVAPTENGIEIDCGDTDQTRFRVEKDGVKIIHTGSTCIFARNPNSTQLPMPILNGKESFSKIRSYLNVSGPDQFILMALISYVLAHPKTESTNYPLLVLFGAQGYGKSFLTKLLLKLIDPSNYGLRTFPNSVKELAIMTNSSHAVAFDNARDVSHTLSDALCMASTGGNVTGRQLYTDADTNSTRLHAFIILNGILPFITQPDLAQRCIQINLLPIDQASRKSEAEMLAQLDQDLPSIYGGLLEYISAVFAALPQARVIHAERMIDFSRWLAAMEIVDQAPEGVYQSLYSSMVEEGQLEVIQGSLLGDAMYAFGMKQQIGAWVGTPTALLSALNAAASPETIRSPDWPKTSISLAKKIAGIKAPLEALGVIVGSSRGKERRYTVSLKEGVSGAY